MAVCTRDRREALRRLLTSLAQCIPPVETWEVIVVDNGSADDTALMVADFHERLPIRVVSEPVPGLSRARNAAVHSARGTYIVWTDDDCVVGREWLSAYETAFRRFPDAALFGGPIVPRFEGVPPKWLGRVVRRIAPAYAARDLGREPVALGLERDLVPFGANYAIRVVEQQRRPYDERIGRGTELPMAVGEETEVIEGLLRDGVAGRWVPDAVVSHCIPPERQRLSYLRDYYIAYGAYEEWRRPGSSEPGGGPTSLALRLEAFRRDIRFRVTRLVAQPEVWIDDLIAASVAVGRTRARRFRDR